MSQQTKEVKKRIYQPIWEKLKADGSCFIKATNQAQKTLIKGVTKEKYRDEEKYSMLSRLQITKYKHGVKFEIITPPSKGDF